MTNKLRASEQIQEKDRYIRVSEAKRQMVAMLTELQMEIEEYCRDQYDEGEYPAEGMISNIVQQKINSLKGNKDNME